ncbi:MAG: hypothetical protein D3904_05455, partial [Candidatus Electrothrix sp. EH2]|nr:hypothetical protein [Candidatus Electrothrix sp. EH2]
MGIDNKAVFLLTGPESKVFGTAFAVAHKDGLLYLLTCAHVVEQLGGKVKVGEQEAEITAIGSGNSIDLALLRISYGEPPLLLNRIARGRTDMKFESCGYTPFLGKYVLRNIEGRLGKSITFEPLGNDCVEAWDLHVEGDSVLKLLSGCSGSPLCDGLGRVVGVVSNNANSAAGRCVHGVAVVNLKNIYSEFEYLIPSFSTVSSFAPSGYVTSKASFKCKKSNGYSRSRHGVARGSELLFADRIAQAKKQLWSLLPDFDIDDKLIKIVHNEFKRMEEKGICSEDEALLEQLDNIIDRPSELNVFVRFLESLEKKRENNKECPDDVELVRHSWNRKGTVRQWMKNLTYGSFVVFCAGSLVWVGNNWWVNNYGSYLQLRVKKDVFDRIEVDQGSAGGVDIFRQRHFLYESSFLRQELERLPRYAENGLYRKISDLVDNILASKEKGLIRSLPAQLASVRTAKSIVLLQRIAKQQMELKIITAIVQLGDKVTLTKFLADKESMPEKFVGEKNVRLKVAAALGMLGDSSGVSELVKLLADEDEGVRYSAAEALGMLEDSSVARDLVPLLADEDAYVRSSAARALGELGDSSGFVKLLTDEDAYVRSSAARALGELGDSSVVRDLVPLLADEDASVRRSAAEALGMLGDSSVAPEL